MTRALPRLSIALAMIALFCTAAYAAQISSQPHTGYERLTFTFKQPAKLTVDAKGTTITLHFNEALGQSADAVTAKLKGYATSASLSADGKTLTITTNKAYRTRHFVSGTMVGLDFIGAGDASQETADADDNAEEDAALTTKKPAPVPAAKAPEEKPAAKPVKKEAPKAAAKTPDAKTPETKTTAAKPAAEPKPQAAATAPAPEAKTIAPAPAAADAMLTTKPAPAPATAPEPASAPVVAEKKPAPAQPVAAAKEAPLLTTKKEPEPAAPVADPKLLTTKAPPAPAVAAIATPEKMDAPKPADTLAEASKTEPAKTGATPGAPASAPEASAATDTPKPLSVPTPAAKPAAPQPAVATLTSGPFIVNVRADGENAVMTFPYAVRTAAAVFERGNSVWIVFSRAADVNASHLKSMLPPAVKKVTQYNYPGHTVVQLTTDGSLHPNAEQIKGSYGWTVSLTRKAVQPTLDIAVSVDSTEGPSRLLLGTFDVADTLTFYDPTAGDLLLIVPTFEAGRGMAGTHHFPQLTLLATNEGVAVASALDDIRTHQSRLGLTLQRPDGLALTRNLAVQDPASVPGDDVAEGSGILLPYELWHVAPENFKDTLLARQQALTVATPQNRPQKLLALATLYLGQGFGNEAQGYLDLLAANEPEFYKAHKLALLSVAAQALQHHEDDVIQGLAAPELANLPEAELWRDYASLFVQKANPAQLIQQAAAPAKPVPPKDLSDDVEPGPDGKAPAPTTTNAQAATQPIMRFLKFNPPYIHLYPPRVRQLLTAAAADAYIANGFEEKALAAYDSLNRDEILGPLKYRADYAKALTLLKTKKIADAEKLLAQLRKQDEDPETKAKARIATAMLKMNKGEATPEESAAEIELARVGWHGDAVERDALKTLAGIYRDSKHYDGALRSLKALNDGFPDDPDYLTTTGQMTDLFEGLYLKGLADDMPPLSSLSLFYEFRDLTPIGEKGDLMIQRLADRLASFDLLDRAAQLLENQITYRTGGEDRSRVGARLALIYLLNHQQEEALRVIEVTNFGGNPPELQRERQELAAQALSSLGRYEEALNMLYNDPSTPGQLLKLDVLWAAKDWPNVINTAEEILAKRTDLTAVLTPTETEVLLKLALGYSFAGDYTQLRYLRDYYSNLLPNTAYKQIFDFVTNDTTPLDNDDTSMLTDQIKHTEGFLGLFKDKIAAGKLSETIK